MLENAGEMLYDHCFTRNDESNTIVCQLASSLFNVSKKIARIEQRLFRGKWENSNKSNIPIGIISQN